MNAQEQMAAMIRELEKRVEALEAHERSLLYGLATEDVELIDAGSAGASFQDWIEIKTGGVQGFLRVYDTK